MLELGRKRSSENVARVHAQRGLTSLVAVAVGLIGLLTACESPAQRQAERNAESNQEVTAEITRICLLPPDQRDTELKKIKEQSGMVLYCGSK